MALAITTVAILYVVHFGNIIWNGVWYTICSAEKHLAELWAAEKGDWSHWMTGLRYEVFKEAKQELIANSWFAAFISSLAGRSIILKSLQVAILIACNAVFVTMLYVDFRCAYHFLLCCKKVFKHNTSKKAYRQHATSTHGATHKTYYSNVTDFNDYRQRHKA
jgi:hypothetical protein